MRISFGETNIFWVRRSERESEMRLTLLVEDNNIAAGEVDGVSSAQAGNCKDGSQSLGVQNG